MRISAIVTSIPAMDSAGLICLFTFLIVLRSCSNPLMDKKCAWAGISTSSAAARAFIVSIPSDGIQSRIIASYASLTVWRYWRRIVSRLMMFTRVTSSPDSSIFAGRRSTPSPWWRIPPPSGRGVSMIIAPNIVASVTLIWSGCWYPRLAVREPCGSASTKRTFFPSRASPIPIFTELVVFAHPPFWLHRQ